MIKNFLPMALFLTCLSAGAQQSCANYPYDEGIDIQDVNGGTKILATAQVAVLMDDIDSIKDAREEATIEAKALIAKFLTEDIKSDTKIEKSVSESKQSDGQSVEVSRRELVSRVKSLRNSSQALLRGVVPLGSCYSKGREFRMTVGIKPETIRSAGNLSGSMNGQMRNQSSTQGASNVAPNQPAGASMPLRGMDGHSSTERIDRF